MTNKKRSHGEGNIEQYRPGVWRIRYMKPDGTRGSKAGFKSEKLARSALMAVVTDIDRGEYFDATKGNIASREMAEQYIEAVGPTVALGTLRNWRTLLRTTIYPTFGDKKRNQISVRLVEVWWGRHANQAPNHRNAYFLLKPIMDKAVKWNYIMKTPCQIEDAAADVAKPRPTWEPEDLRKVLARDSTGLPPCASARRSERAPPTSPPP